MIERDANRFVELQNQAGPGIDYELYSKPDIATNMTDKLAELVTEDRNESYDPGSEPGQESSASLTDSANESYTGAADRRDLTDLFDQAREVDYSRSSSTRYDDHERREFLIETADGETITLRDRVLRRREEPSANQSRYHWLSPGDLRTGDKIVLFDEEELQDRWQARLEDVYNDELDGTTTVDDLTMWYNSLTSIIEEIMRSEGVEEPTHSRVRSNVTSRATSIDREQVTVWNWFESVAEAENPLELAQDSSLTIGPRRPDDIAAVGEEFDVPELYNEATRIEGSMGRIRGTNSREGHQFRENLKTEMNSVEHDELRKQATVHEVIDVDEA
jgi:hypothetical protein